ncbi:hypothetical protein EU805_00050 [Salipiger sp. IMCC34102]|uniref:DUF2161 domain-containing phosphodiesterase n=1 Tax=Salipiger sp. IMCC34102 TaxID=2510647 RepID=UPI00101B8DE5|nr:DUF2161 family putative PD-(D/E)XK-type phosphodiesterase [Salipiger sp. IMCC34102]RYH03801.1 hypothetical protein EU805_00050 [Salipiger sp. IMCC34102]
MAKESDLYPPLKSYFEGLGFEVKGEVGPADLVAWRGEEVVVVELKLGFSLTLFHQAMDRLALTDDVYVAVPAGGRAKAFAANVKLARRLGLGVISVRTRDGFIEVHADPGGYVPRKSPRKIKRLAKAFDRLRGDPNAGGATRHGLVTGYRQDALTCARFLAVHGAASGARIKAWAEVPDATAIMAANHYGWFTRLSRGIYDLTPEGRRALADWGTD